MVRQLPALLEANFELSIRNVSNQRLSLEFFLEFSTFYAGFELADFNFLFKFFNAKVRVEDS